MVKATETIQTPRLFFRLFPFPHAATSIPLLARPATLKAPVLASAALPHGVSNLPLLLVFGECLQRSSTTSTFLILVVLQLLCVLLILYCTPFPLHLSATVSHRGKASPFPSL